MKYLWRKHTYIKCNFSFFHSYKICSKFCFFYLVYYIHLSTSVYTHRFAWIYYNLFNLFLIIGHVGYFQLFNIIYSTNIFESLCKLI